ncbi:MAG: hypothetical protein A2039_03900 [Candidatus Melainabacteria bacterium GWA2_34_9]|nr:MAG: hypothetical protein A2039_03900 [Candidatus Melainabacteria bacterium GWA2_34_9]
MKTFNKKTGFTFTEVIIAIIIIGVTASCLAAAVPSAFITTRKTENLSKAFILASKYLETIKSDLSYKSEYDLAVAGTTPPIELTSDFTDNNYYTVSTEIIDLETETIDGSTVATLKEIDITYKKTGDSKTLANLSTIIARPR